jgi:hypothetical protein
MINLNLNSDSPLSSISTTLEPALASILDVSVVDTYLLQTYIIPSFIQAIARFRHAMITLEKDTQTGDTSSNVVDIILSRLVRCLVPIISLLVTNGYTPAMRQMGLEFTTTTKILPQRPTTTSRMADPRSQLKLLRYKNNNKIMYRLIVYCILQYIVPDLYEIISDQLRQWIDHSSISLSLNHLSSDIDQKRTHAATKYAMARQRQRGVLERIERFLHLFSHRVIPILQLGTLLSCWSGIIHTSELALLLSGLTYRRQQPSPPLLSQPIYPQFHFTLAHRRWLTYHFLETFRMVVLPSLILIPRIWTPVLRRYFRTYNIATVKQRLKRYIQRILPQQKPHQYDLQRTITCPFCQKIPPTIAVQADCICQQIYCYACLYHHIVDTTNINTDSVVLKTIAPPIAPSELSSYQVPMQRKHFYCLRCDGIVQNVTTITIKTSNILSHSQT